MKKELIGISEQEAEVYIKQIEEKEGKPLESIRLEADGDYVNVRYETEQQPFERIRRITGYLVGTMERWNDAKTAEESQRVKHSM
ncbi:MAG: hypothetical protein IKS19_01820 [Clostridia bacterium]|nr:hypothetical protein [Clostridia bacterium]